MSRSSLVVAIGVAAAIALPNSAPCQQRLAPAKKVQEPLVEQVRKAIDRGIQFLRDQENGHGHWELDPFLAATNPGGETCLALLALLNAGVKPDDQIIERGLKYIRSLNPQQTYVVGLQTMVFAQAGKKMDGVAIQRNVDWLVKARVMNGRTLNGWSYGTAGHNLPTTRTLSTPCSGFTKVIKPAPKIERGVGSIRDFYVRTQHADGGGISTATRGSRLVDDDHGRRLRLISPGPS